MGYGLLLWSLVVPPHDLTFGAELGTRSLLLTWYQIQTCPCSWFAQSQVLMLCYPCSRCFNPGCVKGCWNSYDQCLKENPQKATSSMGIEAKIKKWSVCFFEVKCAIYEKTKNTSHILNLYYNTPIAIKVVYFSIQYNNANINPIQYIIIANINPTPQSEI